MRASGQPALTLVELVIVMVVSGILFAVTTPLVLYGVRTFIFLPRGLAANQTAAEILHQIVEGGFSTLSGQATVPGLRFAARDGAQPAIWNVQASQVGFRTSDSRCVVIQLTGGVVKRSAAAVAPGAACAAPAGSEDIPYAMPPGMQILAVAPAFFRYYNQGGLEVPPNPPPIRRVDIAFVVQTGGGNFNQGEAREQITSSVAIRMP